MRGITYFGVGLLALLIFIILNSPIMTGGSRLNIAFAGPRQTVIQKEAPAEQRVYDPYENSGRKVFKFNDLLYFGVVNPSAQAYSVLPQVFRKAVRNGFHNLVFPSRFVNFVLQGKPHRAGNEMTRFVINSTVGVAGLFDVAQNLGIHNHESDFGQTLGVWGVGPGPFLMVPALGPSDERDLVGYAVDAVMDPLIWFPGAWWISMPPEAGRYVNEASLKIGEYEAFKKASLDPYSAMRDAYMQYRANLVSENHNHDQPTKK